MDNSTEGDLLSAVVVMDYQNVHLTAVDRFDWDGAPEDSLIHPKNFAVTAIAARNSRQKPGYPHARLRSVVAFRGLPSPEYEPDLYRRCDDQARQWRRDMASVHLRPLKYDFVRDATGEPVKDVFGKKTVKGRPREKGVDVLVAVECLMQALNPGVDLVILASHDSDLAPVVERIRDMRRAGDESVARIETASWFNAELIAEDRSPGGQIKVGSKPWVWNTRLGRGEYEASLDRNTYR